MCSFSSGVMLSQNCRDLAEVVVVRRRVGAGLRPTRRPAPRPRRTPRPCAAGVEGAATVERVRPVRRDSAVHRVLVEAVAQHVVDRRVRPVDRDLVEVRPAQPGQLGVDVGEQPRLQQRVVGDVDARHQVAEVEGDLLGLGEEVGRVARSASAGRSPAPARAPRARAWWGRAGRCPRRSPRRCPGRPARRAPTAGRRRTRWRRPGRGGGSRGPCPPSICASSQVSECTPSTGFQWNFTSEVSPWALTQRKVWTPKPSIVR